MKEAAKPRLAVRLFNGAQRLAQALGRRPARFTESEASLLETACKATRLNDFGDEAFRPHLRVLLRAYDEEAQLTPFGRMMVNQELSGILKSRLSVQHAWTQQPSILQAPIRRPIFILGLPRTGTTALHFLLGQDPANQVLEYWLAAAPGPRPPRSEWEQDPRFVAAVRGLKMMYYLDPSLKAIHLMTADGPDECRHLFLQSFLDDTFDSNATIPSYTKWYAQQDMHPVYALHRDILKLIQSPQPQRRWVLKYPAHMRNLRVLLETYPDACIVQTHRDPARVLPSICSLVAGWRGLYEGAVDRAAVGQWQLDMWSSMVRSAIEVRGAGNPAQFFDFSFQELVSDPIAAITRMYQYFGFDLTAEAERGMQAWHVENPQGKHGGHHYSPEDFGLSAGVIGERFAPYMRHFQIPKESGRPRRRRVFRTTPPGAVWELRPGPPQVRLRLVTTQSIVGFRSIQPRTAVRTAFGRGRMAGASATGAAKSGTLFVGVTLWLLACGVAAPSRAQPVPTPTFVPRSCTLLGSSGVSINALLVDLTLPLSGSQTWRFGDLQPNQTRPIVLLSNESHFDCSTTTFSGQNVRVCARLDDDAGPGLGVVDCGGGNLTGYDSLVQIDHNTNQDNVGFPQDPNCTNTFTAPDGTVLHSCLEGTDPACSGGAHIHTGVCNSPPEQTFSGVFPAGGFRLHETIDLSLALGADCSTPCPADGTPLQDGELQIAGDMTSGQAEGVIWQVNDTSAIMGTTGAEPPPPICGSIGEGNCFPYSGAPMGNCLADVTISDAAAVVAYPVIDFDPTIGDFLASLRLEVACTGPPMPTQPPTPTPTLGANDCCQCSGPLACSVPTGGSCGPSCTPVFGAVCTDTGNCSAYTPTPTDTATPTWTPRPTWTPTSTPTPTVTPTPPLTPAVACAVAPRTGCQAPQRAAGISLNAAYNTVRWEWLGGATPVSLAQFGDPLRGATAYHLCVYDTSAGPPSLAFAATVPAGGTCGAQPCWKQTRPRLAYSNSAATPDGVRRMTLQPSGRMGAAIVVRGRGHNLHMPVSADGVLLLRDYPQVIVQLQRSDDPGCWESVFASPPMRDTRWAFASTIR